MTATPAACSPSAKAPATSDTTAGSAPKLRSPITPLRRAVVEVDDGREHPVDVDRAGQLAHLHAELLGLLGAEPRQRAGRVHRLVEGAHRGDAAAFVVDGHEQVLAEAGAEAGDEARRPAPRPRCSRRGASPHRRPRSTSRSTSGSVASVTPGSPTTSTRPARSSSEARVHTWIGSASARRAWCRWPPGRSSDGIEHHEARRPRPAGRPPGAGAATGAGPAAAGAPARCFGTYARVITHRPQG